jgi:hypothetical protein
MISGHKISMENKIQEINFGMKFLKSERRGDE